ncbi:MAG: hypothetical protein H0W43_06235 [Chthoniobacterales bacterium]|jgi:hypothetical protein|nr:hypothetical protein [Chthoniobacterales bacterium]
MSAQTIHWLVDDQLQYSSCGHGLCFYAGQPHDRSRIVAFVDGFGWLHADEDAVVRYLPDLAQDPQFPSLQTAIESLVRSKKFNQEAITEDHWCGING